MENPKNATHRLWLILTWSAKCIFTDSIDAGTFAITDTKLYIPVKTSSTQDSKKLLQQIKLGFKYTVSWNKHINQKNNTITKPILGFLIDPSFLGVKGLFMLPFENSQDRTSHTGYYLPKVETKGDKVMVDGRKIFDQFIENDIKTYDKIRRIAVGQRDGYKIDCLLDYTYFKENHKLTAIDLCKQWTLDADPKAIQQINFTGNLHRAGNTKLFIIKEEKETILDWEYCKLNLLALI